MQNSQYKTIKSQYLQHKEGWKKSFMTGFSQDSEGLALPWMTYNFIEFISKKLQKSHLIFEFGSGSSTLFFARKVCKIVALESNEKWFEIMKIKLEEEGIKNVELVLMKDALTNADYENFAKNFVDGGEKFDFIFIDSLKRFACAKNCIEALKPDGAIVLDDSERENYKKIFDFFKEKNFKCENFFGIAPGQIRMKNTTIFYRDEI